MDAFRDSSSSSYRCSYHAFLSFRGQDTRKGFTDHLYRALELAGIHTFRDDDEIKRGENIESELDKAIQESQVSIIVFSKDYASSRWCLNELLKIVERRNTDHRHVVLPVFYDVDPSDVRKQSGPFAEAFARHEERFSTEMDKVEQWRRALGDVASLGGMVLGDRSEGQFIQEIVEEIRNKVDHAALDVAPFSVGMDYRVERLNMWLQDGSNDVGVAVICGMGGIGKSTIAKAAYNRNFDRFQGSSFLADIRESSEQPHGFARLQRKLLSDIQKGKAKKVYNMDEGTIKIKQAVAYKKVLIVLDDVSNRDQLNAILGMREWLHPGSKIIITTRHEHLLNAHEVFEKFTVPELNEYESLELFSWHAFRQSHPEEGYMELSRHVVRHCGGLPLALQVVGSSLSGKSEEVWQSALQKLDVIPNDKIQKVLRISFDSLPDDHDKNLFLHIASFFTGKTMDYTITILDNLEFCTRIGIENLVDRCLLKMERGWNRLVMHQLVRNMAMAIIREESPHDPGKRSRVLQKDASNILRKLSQGTENIKGLMLNLASKRTFVGSDKKRCHVEDYDGNCSRRRRLGFFSWKPISFSSTNSASASNETDFKSEAFRRMHNLEILILNNVNIRGSYEEFSKNLVCLSWRGFHLKSIPENFCLENLVVLDMRNSSLQHVWNGTRVIPRLKILNFSHSHGLRTIPDFSGLYNLERLILKHCLNLVEVHESIGHLEKLLVLNLKGCKNLMKLPILRSIQDLILSGCSKLEMKKLNLVSSKSWYSVWSWVSPRKNTKLSSFSLASLPRSLTSLSLDCCNISEIPSALTMLSSLEYLNLDGNPITSLPESMNNLVKLRTLKGSECRNLTTLPELPHSLTSLTLVRCNISEIPSSLTMLSSLKYLNLHGNPITSLPESMNNLVKLQTLRVSGCRNLTMLPELPRSLTSLNLACCNISEIPSALTMLSLLKYLDLDGNPITSLPESMNNLVNLQTLDVTACRNLTMLPELPRSLEQLRDRGCASLKRITN
ncbi:disease resistance protein RPV1-like isoform X1 [Malus sylvestris]|uniref:disease resistance protein RPV1-like isoform X1 n=1 Tax=Malus sylvestris TaxID=3752 RepID=UPI0021AC9904|nr:disease resistance protein RPV1-like isoform X1 [Malus sylvestris]XP_050136937.1 disease resistance protein RPV1-like isoform X1 [Malus sylvestris]XP_050136938.1 disease resistance protein RPV1-like isoform X1 [Malus sylvestris]XP_050136939.1 disease resistance protein RPV1-like isoform X1 [Malus sylvestris]XP_050136940.1 disease resistance protein RPV1-like isoform X1 [Malus sylvestris]XP_050136941.1 disease resistance protein RPV1-like isoform X1 [Malus sylvestris]XP_050136942.1 disease 